MAPAVPYMLLLCISLIIPTPVGLFSICPCCFCSSSFLFSVCLPSCSCIFSLTPHSATREQFETTSRRPPPSSSPGYYCWLSFWADKMLMSSQRYSLNCLFCSLCWIYNGENQQKRLYEIQFWARRYPNVVALTGARHETIQLIKTSGISDTYSPRCVTYFSCVLLKNEVFYPCVNLWGKNKRGLN